MKSQIRFPRPFILGMLLALLPALGRAEEESLENLQIAHSTAMAAAQAEADKRMFLLKVGYEGALQKLAAELAESGDLDGALAVRRERTSFGDTPLSTGEMKALTPKIAMLRKKYDGALIANAKLASQEREALLRKFADMLLFLQRALATAGNGEDSAAAGNAHEEALKELRDVSTGIQLPGGYDLFYTFDVEVEAGESQHDLSPSETRGTSKESGWVESGYRGGAYGIQGGEKRIALDPKLPFSGDAMTISAWVKLDKYGFYSRFWSQFEFGAKRGFVCVFHEGRPFLEYWDRPGKNRQCHAPASKALPLGQWHQVTFTFDSSKCVIYVDGEIVVEADVSPIRMGAGRARVGAGRSGELPLRGTIDDLIHYPRALDRREVSALYQALSKRPAE